MEYLYEELNRLIAEEQKTTDPVRKQELNYEIENCVAEIGA